MKGVNQKVVRTVTAFLACIILVEVVYFAIDEQLQASFTPILISMQTIFRSEMDDYATDPDIVRYSHLFNSSVTAIASLQFIRCYRRAKSKPFKSGEPGENRYNHDSECGVGAEE
ncbi:hypothetical protein SUGI_0682670 [Cryptomeria japonica]|nr:hypothetical protein SUGI_0682670 [Cryptomeria japonica]